MARKIGAGIAAAVGLALLFVAGQSPASPVARPERPSVGWLVGEPAVAPVFVPTGGRPASAAVKQPAHPPAAAPAAVGREKAATTETAGPARPAPLPATAGPAPAPKAAAVAALSVPRLPPPAPPAHKDVVKPPEPLVARAAPPPPALSKPASPPPAPAKPEPAPAAAAKAAEPVEPVEEAGTGTLAISSAPSGAEVYLDGASVGQAPIEIDVPSGVHRIRLVEPGGGAEKRQAVQVKSGRTAEVVVNF